MGTVTHWMQSHHWPTISHHPRFDLVGFLKGSWLTVLLLVLGLFALVTAVLVAWPVVAHLAARFAL